MHFGTKNYLKSTRNHTIKYAHHSLATCEQYDDK